MFHDILCFYHYFFLSQKKNCHIMYYFFQNQNLFQKLFSNKKKNQVIKY